MANEIDWINEKNYLWEHFKFNADQRIKAFNLFVVFSVFSNGGAFAAFEKGYPLLLTGIIGAFISLLAVIFFAIDVRSRQLTRLAVDGLKMYEDTLSHDCMKLFQQDEINDAKLFRYTSAFRVLYGAQFLFGLVVIFFGLFTDNHSGSLSISFSYHS